jgi:hypothetical protein
LQSTLQQSASDAQSAPTALHVVPTAGAQWFVPAPTPVPTQFPLQQSAGLVHVEVTVRQRAAQTGGKTARLQSAEQQSASEAQKAPTALHVVPAAGMHWPF